MISKIHQLKKDIENLDLVKNFLFSPDYLSEHRVAILFNKIDQEVERKVLAQASNLVDSAELVE
jgi:hypothetical protein